MTNLADLLARGIGGVAFDPVGMACELAAYGEPAAASAITALDSDALAQISVRAGKLLTAGLTIDKAICLATVEVLEGVARPLKRKRRSYKT